ncbi:MAG: aromatic ring-hydroxylating dioxygenase subunit alpha [Candidatus Caenarcaniphilales bacterium]|nr:aromatic ring-hydroxylating dioxygenase subunit alpha [Candidatus Caenarcaniphilales bacterium]
MVQDSNKNSEKNFWYIVAESSELKSKPIKRQILGELLVCFRDKDGKPVVFLDCCLHRSGQLSQGWVEDGALVCPYHGWKYDSGGHVCRVPSEGPESPLLKKSLKTKKILCKEEQGYIYVLLGEQSLGEPFRYPYFKQKNWATVRLKNFFHNNVTNCVENFIDIPHTVFVHDAIFRLEKGHKVEALVKRQNGQVHTSYKNETNNLGSFSWFLNPSGGEIKHIDIFFTPNITNVTYDFPNGWKYVITSQSVPVSNWQTMVYTDITYDFGFWTKLAWPIVKRQAQKVIDQDLRILKEQGENIKLFRRKFINTEADLIHELITELRDTLQEGEDPLGLPDKEVEISFFI